MSLLLKKYKYPLILAVIIISSSFLLFYRVDWGFTNMDERVIVDTALRMIQDRRFMPDIYDRPDHLLIIINSLVFRLVFLVYDPVAEGGGVNTEVFYIAARVVTGVFAIGSVIVSYVIGKKYSDIAAVICAFLFAFLPPYVLHAHYASPDVPITFFMLLFTNISLNYMQKPDYKNLLLMSFATAGFITIKYSGAILCAMIAISVIVSSMVEKAETGKKIARIVRHGAAAIASLIVFIFIISPALYLNIPDVIEAFLNEATTDHIGHEGFGFFGNLWAYIGTYVTASGITLLVFFFFGCYVLFSKERGESGGRPHRVAPTEVIENSAGAGGGGHSLLNIPLFYSFIYWICLCVIPLFWERWALPMYVAPLLISAIGIGKAFDVLSTGGFLRGTFRETFAKREFLRKGAIVIVVLVLCISAVNLISSSYRGVRRMSLPNTLTVSRAYLEENDITEDNTVYEGYSTFDTDYYGTIFWRFEEHDGIYYLMDRRKEYILLSSTTYSGYKDDPERFSDEVAFYSSLERDYTEIMRFQRNVTSGEVSKVELLNIYYNIDQINRMRNGITGPTIIVYKVEPHNYLP